jgi:hypothetical protein
MRVKIEVFGKTTADIGKAIEKARRDFLGGACRVLHTGQDSSYPMAQSSLILWTALCDPRIFLS